MPPSVPAAIYALRSLRYHGIIREVHPFYIAFVVCNMLLLRIESGTQILFMITLEAYLVVLSVVVLGATKANNSSNTKSHF